MKNGTISLYTFHLARTFNDPLDRVSEEKAKIFGEELQTRLTQQISLNNELITRLLHDTYFTDLTFSSPDKIDLIPDEIDRFNPSQFLPQNIQNINAAIGQTTSIGQTIFIYVKVAYKIEANRDLADSYVRNFLKDTPYKNDKITASNESNLLGIPLFEYFCHTPAISNTQEPVCHILVLLNYEDKKAVKKLVDCYKDIVELLCSYHKIKFVYQQADVSYQAAVKVSQEIAKEIDNFVLYVADKNNNLDKLSEMLDKLPLLALKHSNYCGELEFSLTTIEINHQIYKNYLQKLLSEGSQLDSWQKFSDRTRDIFLKQIQYWLNYMSPRKELGQQLTASIQTIVEIEQVKSDRNLQTTIAVVAVGIGFAGVAATASPYLIKQIPDQKLTLIPVHFQPSFGLNPPHNLTLSVLFSLGAGIVGVAIAARVIRYIQKHQKSRIARIVNFILGNSQPQ
ncbi:hypothetical protein [Floridanema evergladense]|uniref:Uncharacterized protein n=1 Tax=Floridaenema evergladense BLCC-F167 TaxID=3153639 RepID=A0ABV4WTN5_9CYAN